MVRLYRYCIYFALLAACSAAKAGPLWANGSTLPQSEQVGPYRTARYLSLDMPALETELSMAPLTRYGYAYKSNTGDKQIQLPMPDGSMRAFRVYESPVMEHALARKFPQLKSYKVFAADDETVSGRLSLGPKGFHAYLNTAQGDIYIDPLPAPDTDRYVSYYKKDYTAKSPSNYSCGARREPAQSPVYEYAPQLAMALYSKSSNERLTYTIAVAATGEYSQAVDPGGPTVIGVLDEINIAITRVNQIYERDLSIHLDLVANNDQLIYLDPVTDPYTNNSATALVLENQSNIDNVIGSANYDIGHVFNTGGGGLAAFEVVCVDGSKARAETGLPNPVGDPFYIDLVAHEIGHQFGADHSFNGTTDACGANRNATTAFEPGSGSTIMSYAGICGSENISNFADATFHAGSIEQMINYSRLGAGNTCDGTTFTVNTGPVIGVLTGYTIPALTPFVLTGSATDVDLDTLSYQWDQMDAGNATTAATYGSDLCTNAMFRSFAPVSVPSRTFPSMTNLLSGSTDKAETLPATSRDLNFRLTVRDGNGGVDENDVVLTVDGNSGPFSVLQPNTNITLDSSQPQVIEWNSACTELAPVNCANVDILLSTDGGGTYNSLVGGSTPNDGSETINFGSVNSGSARIKIACVGNIFFDISDMNFTLSSGAGNILALTGAGGSSNCNQPANCAVTSSGYDQEPNDSPTQAVSIDLPITINGNINDAIDVNDYYVFVASSQTYDFTLSGYGSNDLDLYLLDSSGSNIISESSSALATTESISVGLVLGETYYIVVNGYDTGGLESAYTLTITAKAAPPPGDDGGLTSLWLVLTILVVLSTARNPERYGPISRVGIR